MFSGDRRMCFLVFFFSFDALKILGYMVIGFAFALK